MRPAVRQLTRTFGPHSKASDVTRLMRPAFAAPYAAVFGDGRMPLTDVMLMIEPPLSCCCMTALAACDTFTAARRLSATIFSVKRGDAVAASAGGAPPALFTA